ncbi:MAG: 30S ribosomal protein S6 [Patescibacteria group bacterium]
MTNYELLYIVSNQYTDDEAEKIKTKVDGLIKKYGGLIGYNENFGKKRLAYPIKKALHGYYLVTEFEMEDASALKGLVNDLNLDKEILRAQIITRPKNIREELAKARSSRPRINAPLNKDEVIKEKAPKDKDDAKSKKISIENLDEKLDEMLKDDNIL